MAIYEFCMFHNEHEALAIKRAESGRWVDELHLVESTRTFKGGPRSPALPDGDTFLRPHLFDGEARFYPAVRWGPSRRFPFFRRKSMARRNETIQRNFVHEALAGVADDDIVILSDIDEIIDPRHADEIVDAARKHGLVSVRLHHTLFYLNLYSTNWHEVWPGSPRDYAYRVFVMTGARFRALGEGSDRLRRRGEWGQLEGEVPLLEGFRGFHHSWLGDEKAALDKLNSYAHSLAEHRGDLAGPTGEVTSESLARFIREGHSIFPGNTLELRSFEEVAPLPSVAANPERYRSLIL